MSHMKLSELAQAGVLLTSTCFESLQEHWSILDVYWTKWPWVRVLSNCKLFCIPPLLHTHSLICCQRYM